jgi:2-succinyl-5-enolpyruvyl-6-hydroxy-3-cyclohexene-1-carboxylate synthase
MPAINPMDNIQHIFNLVELCACKGVRHTILCPGSRCAPLLVGFGKHKHIETISVTDERSAGFIGLGIAQQTNSPVVLVCTSGTAGQNFAPAVTEAFYQNVPLIVLTADRPAEWIDQWDGQTIHQQTLYGEHLRAQLTFQQRDHSLKQAESIIDQSMIPTPGPIHINIPISKPFYPQGLKEIVFPTLNIIPPKETNPEIPEESWEALEALLKTADKLLVVAGQQTLDEKLLADISQLKIPLVGDLISNIHTNKHAIQTTDAFFDLENDNMRPDLLVTIGRSVISENLKRYFRKHKPANHWHIGTGMVGDPFQSLTQIIQANPNSFFKIWLQRGLKIKNKNKWQDQLNQRHQQVYKHISASIHDNSLNQFTAIQAIVNALPHENTTLHLGNSMPVRVANYIDLNKDKTTEVFSNRGTSGIDGTLSTAVGHALAQANQTHILIIGDLAFFYDRNGLWLNHRFPRNLKIIVLNNSGGGIFTLLPGPSDQDELFSLFNTPHQRSVKLAAEEFSLRYFLADSLSTLEKLLASFLTSSESAILEITVQSKDDKRIFQILNSETIK